MANKKISELTTRTPSLTDLILVGDPSNGFSYKCTVSALATIIETDIADGYVTLGTTQTISGAKTFSNNLTLTSVANASTDPDKFLVLNGSNVVNYRTGSEVLSDIGGQGTITLTTTGTSGAATLVGNTLNIPNYAPDLSGYVPTSRTITINGTTQDLTANRTYNVGTVTSVALSAPTGFAVTGSPITSSGTLALAFDTGYSLPTTASQTNWDTAYTNRITSLTTTGSSGAATLISNTLNIPNYTLAGLGGISLTSLSASAPLSYNNTTGAFSISQSNTSTDGYLSSTDWNTFNGKIGGSGTSNYVPKFTATSTLGNSQIFDNGTNVGINTATPSEKLEVSGILRVSRTTSASVYLNVTAESGNIIFDARGSSDQIFHTQTSERLRIGLGGDITISTINNATIDTDKFLVSDSGVIKYRTGSEILSDIGGQGALTLTTTGTSGAATLVGNTLNIPQYSGGGGTVSGTTNYIAKFTSSTAVGDSQLFDNGTNVGVFTTPSAWSGTGINALQIGNASIYKAGNFETGYSANTYYDGSTFRYISTGVATNYTIVNGVHAWQAVASGTAGAAFTWTRQMTLDASGNLGINTTTIGSRLQVNGGAAIGYSASTSAPTNGLTVAGNVGIGIASAATNLHVYRTTAGLSGMQVSNLTHGSTVTDGMFVGVDDTQGYIYMYENLPIQLSTNSTVRLFINNDGTVFVGGTNAPASPTTGILSGSGATGTNVAGAELRIRGGASTGNAAGGIISFYTSAAGTAGTTVNSGTEVMRIASGNTPVRISVNGTELYSGMNITNSSSTANLFIGNGGSAVSNVALRNVAYMLTSTAASLAFGTNDAIRMTINSTGLIGIGTTTIGSTLQVNGNAAIGYSASTAAPTNGLMVAGNVGVNVTPSAWASGFRAIQIGARAAIYNTDINFTGLNNNQYYDGSFWRYLTTAAASSIELGVGVITFGNAASGTAGATVSGTERARIHTDGVFYIGNGDAVASPNTGIISATGGSGTNIAGAEFRIRGGASTGSANGGAITFYTSTAGASGTTVRAGTEKMRITSDGQITLATGANVSAIAQTGYSLTGSNASSLIDLAGTWNTTGNPTAIKLNITNTASGTGADLMELQVGGVNQFLVTKAGNISLGGSITTDTPTGGTKKAWKLGSVVVTGSWVIDSSRYVEVEIDGTAYKLALAIAP